MYELICAKVSIFLSKMVQETIQYAQEMSQDAPGNVPRSPGVITGIYVDVTVVLSATKYASFMVIRIYIAGSPIWISWTFRKFQPFPAHVSWQYFLDLKISRPWR